MDLKMEVYSPGLELLGMLEIQRSIIWEEKAFSAGSFSLESLITDESRALLTPENIIWIEGETAGIIEYVQQEAGNDGPYITVKGRTLTGILDRRILWGLYDLKGTPPVIMHRLVDDCAVNPTRSDTEARKIPGLVLLDPPGGGTSVQIQRTGGTLLEALEIIGEVYKVAFGVRFNPIYPRMEFWTRWGQDRSVNQNVNEPVFYSTELDDVLSSQYSYNSMDYRNVTLVAGEGEGPDRVYTTVMEQVPETPVTPPPTPPEPPTPTTYTITLNVDPSGGGVASGGGTFDSGTSVTLTSAPATDYQFVGWRENGEIVSTNSSYTFTVGANRALTAVFAAVSNAYTVTTSISPAGGGTVSGGGTIEQGKSVTLTQITADGYRFSGWYSGNTLLSTESTYTFTPTGNITVTAKYTAIPVYTVTASIDPAGSGTVEGSGTYQEDAEVTIKAVPGDGYKFTAWKEGGVTVSESAEYTFTISGNRTFTAEFAVKSVSRLPEGYTEVEYIEVSGKLGFNLGITINPTTFRLVMDMEPHFVSGVSGSQYEYIFQCAGASANKNLATWYRYPSTKFVYRYYNDVSGSVSIASYTGQRVTLDIDWANKTLTYGETVRTGLGSQSFTSGTMYLFSKETTTYCFPCKLYSAKIYKSGELYKEYVPCVRDNGTIGLYDITAGSFKARYSTLNNTITAGPAV